MKRVFLMLFAALMITVPAFAESAAGDAKTAGGDEAAPAAKTTASIKPMHHERHPLLHGAMNKLRQAKEKLQDADRDYGGHRVKAIAAIDEALAELKLALGSDKK